MNSDDLTQLLSTLRQLQAPPLPPDVARLLPSHTQPSEKTSFSQDEMKLLLSSLPPSLSQPSPTASTRVDTIEEPSERRTEEEVTKERYRDITTLSFPEALPLLTNLAQDQKFLDAIGDMKVSQEQLELRMKDERNRIARELKHDVKKSTIELRKWDVIAIEQWIELRAHQQRQLERLGVPTFSVTSDPILLVRQNRILAVLLGFLDDD